MQIAYVFSHFGDGGAETHALLLAKKARESGEHPIFVVSHSSITAQTRLEKAGFDFAYLPMNSSFNPIALYKSVRGLMKIIDEKGVNVVHTHMLREQSIAILAKLFGSKFILIRTFHRFDQFNRKTKILLSFYKKYTDAFISISDNMTKYMNDNGLNDNVIQINNGVEKVDADTHEPAIGFIGRLAKEKGVLKFIDANQIILRDTKMVIAGEGPEFEAIGEFVKEKQLNVEMMGSVLDKAEFFRKVSVLVLPSETEVMPLVILEAYSCGLPVVAFDLPSLRGLVDSVNGRLIAFPNYLEMGKMAAEFMASNEYYRQTNIEAYEHNYSAEAMWEKTAILYRSLYNTAPNMVK